MPDFTSYEFLIAGVWTGAIAGCALLAIVAYALATTKKPAEGGGSEARSVLQKLQREPALIGGFISAVAALGAAFGFELSAEQTAALTTVVVAAVTIVVRLMVTPVNDPDPKIVEKAKAG